MSYERIPAKILVYEKSDSVILWDLTLLTTHIYHLKTQKQETTIHVKHSIAIYICDHKSPHEP